MSTVYLNGDYLPVADAKISVDDRGFLFSDGIYEVTPSYRGALFGWDRHLQRLLKGLCELRIDQDVSKFKQMHDAWKKSKTTPTAKGQADYYELGATERMG